jgi:DNA-binding GntR family transcriptional regulator
MSAKESPEAAIAAIAPLRHVAGEATDEVVVERHPGEPGYEPLGQAIARRVRDAVLDGRLAPGTRIRQEALAQRLGVSRIPVREALRQLETEGIVTLVPHSGARVARLDFDEHLELYRLREALEPIAVAASVPHLTEERLAELDELAGRIEETADDPKAWLHYDRAFHLATYAAAPMPRLVHLIDGFWNTTQQYRRAFLLTLDAHSVSLVHAEHRLILDALVRRDASDAEQRQRQHIRRTRVTLMAHSHLFDMASPSADPPSKETPL